MALGSTQPLTEMSTRRIYCDIRLTNLPPSCAVVRNCGNLNFLETFGTVQACNGTDLPLPFFFNSISCFQFSIQCIICVCVCMCVCVCVYVCVCMCVCVCVVCVCVCVCVYLLKSITIRQLRFLKCRQCCPQCFYERLQRITKHEVRLVTSDTTNIPNFIKIGQVVHTHTRARAQPHSMPTFLEKPNTLTQ